MIKKAFVFLSLFSCACCYAQQKDSIPPNGVFTLDQCIDYAFQHQPVLKQALINQNIVKTNNAINLSGWYPQVNGLINFTHYFQLPTSVIQNNVVQSGITNTFIPELQANETVFSPSLVYAAGSAKLLVIQSRQITDSTKIFIVAAVSKAFYNLLLTLEQIEVLKEDTARLDKNLSDTYHQYIGGIADKTDYQEATITLNNTKASLKQAVESVTPQYAALKQIMGFPPENNFNVSYDTAQMMNQIVVDESEQLQYDKRIEFQQLSTVKKLQRQNTLYNELNFLPTLGATYAYNYEYENSNFSDLFRSAYPNSYIGVSLNLPLFTGLRRIESVHLSKLQERLLEWSEVNLKSEIYTEYTTALANYKSNLYNFNIMRDNVNMARSVYNIVTLQYRQGIVPYLNVITAESNLISSQIGYLNALFQVLSSKIDLQKAMGNISYNR
jgi:outer membrane protein TolC